MSSGINLDEEKRRLQYMQFRAEQKLETEQNMNFNGKPKVKSPKHVLITLGVVAGLILLVILLSQSGIF